MTQAAPAIDLVAVSPHYDDVVFSCGATVGRAVGEGRRVTVLTVCGGAPLLAADAASPVARALHARWAEAAGESAETNGAPGHDLAVARSLLLTRRAEEEAALADLGASGVALDVCDCIYRRDEATGAWTIPTMADLFTGRGVPEASLAWRVAASLQRLPGIVPETRFLVPLGVGNHVDHRLTRRATELAFPLARLWYYEDVPYALATPPSASAPQDGDDPAPSTAPERGMAYRAVAASEGDLAAKLRAAARYTSQISTFWESTAAMERALRDFAALRAEPDMAFGERFWRAPSAEPTALLDVD